MPKLTPITPQKFLKILQKKGYYVDHQTGSHMILYKDDHSFPLSLPMHNKDMKTGLLHSLLKQAQISNSEYEHLRTKKGK